MMGQREFLAGLDASLHASFEAAGMADSGQYTPPGGGVGVPCQVYVDRNVSTVGGLRQFKSGSVEIDYVRGSVQPDQNGRVLVDGELYTLGSKISDDGSMSRWQVRLVPQ